MSSPHVKFKDLSESCKQKLIELHKKSAIPSIDNAKTHKIQSFDNIVTKIDVYQSNKIKKNLTTIADYLENAKNVQDVCSVENKIAQTLDALEKKIECYNDACKNDAFLDELKKTYMMLSGRYLDLRSKYK